MKIEASRDRHLSLGTFCCVLQLLHFYAFSAQLTHKDLINNIKNKKNSLIALALKCYHSLPCLLFAHSFYCLLICLKKRKGIINFFYTTNNVLVCIFSSASHLRLSVSLHFVGSSLESK